MGKKVVLLAVVCLLTVMAGCSSYGKTNTPTPAPVTSQNQQIATSQTNTTITPAPQKQASKTVPTTAQQKYSYWPYSSLVLPNGKVITSKDYQPSYWKGLNIQLYTALGAANDNLLDRVQDIVGNHTDIVSQDLQPVTLTIGPAILVMVDRTPPAASSSNTVTHECWLIAFHPDPERADRQFVYAIQAILVNVSPSAASSELLELSKGWKLPAFQTQ
jgi:outer membrane murein-binding lipoprotein Lpp